MFLDDELKQIREEGGGKEETALKLIEACINRIENPETVGEEGFTNSIKRIDASWRLFCKSYTEYDPNGFRLVFFRGVGDLTDYAKEVLGW